MSKLLTAVLLLVLVVIALVTITSADYTAPQRLIIVSDILSTDWGKLQVVYDTQGHVDCYLFSHTRGEGISCIQK